MTYRVEIFQFVKIKLKTNDLPQLSSVTRVQPGLFIFGFVGVLFCKQLYKPGIGQYWQSHEWAMMAGQFIEV